MTVPRKRNQAVASQSSCLACDLYAGRIHPPGGLICETGEWRVEHCVGPLGVGTLIAKPKRHVLHVAELTDREAAEMGPLLRATACAVQDLTGAKPGLHVPLVAWRK